ncbi:MAG TPA: flagellar basal body rod protein FlgC [Burkholderiales bacterium]|nr:flagellar basal body rod protein FlgC [Burkholderiales bacterium]
MSLSKIFDISGSAVSAQSQRLNVVASNLANVDSVADADGKTYRARQVVFQAQSVGQPNQAADNGTAGVKVAGIVEDQSPLRTVFNPQHPMANEQGYVEMPNVNVVEEMVNMIAASRSYQNNVEVMNTAKSLLLKTLQLGS